MNAVTPPTGRCDTCGHIVAVYTRYPDITTRHHTRHPDVIWTGRAWQPVPDRRELCPGLYTQQKTL